MKALLFKSKAALKVDAGLGPYLLVFILYV